MIRSLYRISSESDDHLISIMIGCFRRFGNKVHNSKLELLIKIVGRLPSDLNKAKMFANINLIDRMNFASNIQLLSCPIGEIPPVAFHKKTSTRMKLKGTSKKVFKSSCELRRRFNRPFSALQKVFKASSANRSNCQRDRTLPKGCSSITLAVLTLV